MNTRTYTKFPQRLHEDINSSFTHDNFIFEYLKDAANGDSIEMNADGSSVVKNFDFKLIDPDESVLGTWISRINFMVVNSGMNADDFFGLSPLTNGIKINVLDTSMVEKFGFSSGNATIKRAIHFSALAGSDHNFINNMGASEDSSSIRWTIRKAGAPLFLRKSETFRITIQDDLTGITEFRTVIQGTR